MFWGLKWKDPRKFVMERIAFEFRFEECICPDIGYVSIHSLGVGNIVF